MIAVVIGAVGRRSLLSVTSHPLQNNIAISNYYSRSTKHTNHDLNYESEQDLHKIAQKLFLKTLKY